MTETPVYYDIHKRDAKCGTIEPDTDVDAVPLTPEQRQQLLMARSAFINGLRLVESILGCEPSVKTRAEKRER